MKFENKTILITGATAGIGKEILKGFIKRGARKFAVAARNASRLEELKAEYPQVEILTVQADMAVPDDIHKISETIKQNYGKLDILVNNAGVVSAGALEEMSDKDVIGQINVNLTGLILLTKACLPLLKASEEAALMNISSGLGFIAWPFYSVYAATKAAVRQFSDAMRRDLYQYPIHVMTIYPTATATPMMKNAKVDDMDDPKMVAQKSLDGLVNREHHVIFGGDQRILDIELNFSQPAIIDQKAKERYEALRERTENHRSM